MSEEQMSQSDFDAQMQQSIAEEYEKQWAASLGQFDEATDPRNLQYIVSRLAVWDDAKHRTLTDLERDTFSDA